MNWKNVVQYAGWLRVQSFLFYVHIYSTAYKILTNVKFYLKQTKLKNGKQRITKRSILSVPSGPPIKFEAGSTRKFTHFNWKLTWTEDNFDSPITM